MAFRGVMPQMALREAEDDLPQYIIHEYDDNEQ